MNVLQIKKRLRALGNKEKAKILKGFFKTGAGQYGEGDVFIGITVPLLRKLAGECTTTPVSDILQLLRSPVHEERLLALMLLIHTYLKADLPARQKIFSLYIRNIRHINNWDLVDLSAPNIVGYHLADKPRNALYELARSRSIWKRRIAMVSTFHFIRHHDFHDTLNIARILLNDDHDLIQKASGWMLREVGKRDIETLERFLSEHYKQMPRTMLRYAIERFPEAKRVRYLNGKF